MSGDLVSTQYRLNEITHKKLKYICAKEKRSMNAQIDYYVTKGIEEYERAHGKIVLEDLPDGE